MKKKQKKKKTPDSSKIESGLVQLIMMGKSIRQILVNVSSYRRFCYKKLLLEKTHIFHRLIQLNCKGTNVYFYIDMLT